MEREFKWKANSNDYNKILKELNLSEDEAVEMHASYYDTAAHWLRSHKIALRLRRENDKQVCCLKLQDSARDGLHVHDEFECAAASLTDGLNELPKYGAPNDLCCALKSETLIAVCETKFHRRRATWQTPDFTAEIVFDEGVLICQDKQQAFTEIECEQKSGNDKAFESACMAISEKFVLKSEAKSKFSRALDLERA